MLSLHADHKKTQSTGSCALLSDQCMQKEGIRLNMIDTNYNRHNIKAAINIKICMHEQVFCFFCRHLRLQEYLCFRDYHRIRLAVVLFNAIARFG